MNPIEPAESKLTKAKIRFAEEKRFMRNGGKYDTNRLPPGQSLTKGMPVLDLGIHPEVDHETWSLTIDGLVQNPLLLNLSELKKLEQTTINADIHCVTSWSCFDTLWRGVSTETLMDIINPDPRAKHVMLHSIDGYSSNLTIEDFCTFNCLIAHELNGEPLTVSHGGPVRIVIPHLYFWKSAKWISRIEFMENDSGGYWEKRGYHNNGNPWLEERYAESVSRDILDIKEPETFVKENIKQPEVIARKSIVNRIKNWINYNFFDEY